MMWVILKEKSGMLSWRKVRVEVCGCTSSSSFTSLKKSCGALEMHVLADQYTTGVRLQASHDMQMKQCLVQTRNKCYMTSRGLRVIEHEQELLPNLNLTHCCLV